MLPAEEAERPDSPEPRVKLDATLLLEAVLTLEALREMGRSRDMRSKEERAGGGRFTCASQYALAGCLLSGTGKGCLVIMHWQAACRIKQ